MGSSSMRATLIPAAVVARRWMGLNLAGTADDSAVDVSVPKAEGGELNRRDMTYVPMRFGMY